MSIETVAVTGGNGTIGRAIIDNLNSHGYTTVNIARGKQREELSDEYLTTDLLDPGEVYGSLSRADAGSVVHMGTIPGPARHPNHITYRSNVMSSLHVLNAAESLGLRSVCLPSSINAIGSAHQESPASIQYLPVDESHPCSPEDPYGIGKHAMEVTADGYGRRDDGIETISSLRYPWVCTEEDLYETFVTKDRDAEALQDAWEHTTRDVLFSYIHIDDAADIARQCVEADFRGHEVFWAVASDTNAAVASAELAREYYSDATVREQIADFQTLIDISKATEMLGWTPKHSWRDL